MCSDKASGLRIWTKSHLEEMSEKISLAFVMSVSVLMHSIFFGFAVGFF